MANDIDPQPGTVDLPRMPRAELADPPQQGVDLSEEDPHREGFDQEGVSTDLKSVDEGRLFSLAGQDEEGRRGALADLPTEIGPERA